MHPEGPAIKAVIEFATNNEKFLQAFLYSWAAATTNGYKDGELTAIGSGPVMWDGNSFDNQGTEVEQSIDKNTLPHSFTTLLT